MTGPSQPEPAPTTGCSRRDALRRVGGLAASGTLVSAVIGCSGTDGRTIDRPARPLRPIVRAEDDPNTETVAAAPPGSDARPRPPAGEPLIRVRTDRIAEGEIELGDTGRRVWLTAPETGFTAMVHGPVRCRRVRDGWSVRSTQRGRTVSRSIRDGGHLTLSAFDIREEGLPFKGRRLAGTVHLMPAGEQGVDLVCHLPMEQYLPGVLGGELFESWLDSTHEALAVAARSFALCERFHWLGRRGYDVVADERSQVWIGAAAPQRSRRAVASTRGELLVWRDLVVPAYYSAACGGRPSTAIEAISPNPVNAIPPLAIPTPDRRPVCGCRTLGSHGSWRLSIPAADVVAAFRRWAASGGDRSMLTAAWPMRFDVVATLPSGRPRTVRVTSTPTRASIELSAVEVQRILNLTGKGRPIRSADVTLDVTATALRVAGAGFGHGVGLCQYGAEAMSRAGSRRGDILARYYPEATVVRSWT